MHLVLDRVMEIVSHRRCSSKHQHVFVMALDPWEPTLSLLATFGAILIAHMELVKIAADNVLPMYETYDGTLFV